MSDVRPPAEPATGPATGPVTGSATGSATDLIPGLSGTDLPVGPSGGEVPPAAAAQPYNFDLVLRGYDRHQVHQHLDRVAAVVEQLQADLAEANLRESAAAEELARLRGELERGRPSFDALGDRVAQILGLAEAEADQLRLDARLESEGWREAAGRDAADIRSDARREADALVAAARREVEELDRRRTRLLADMSSMRDALQQVLSGASEPWQREQMDLTTSEIQTHETQVIDLDQGAPTTTSG